MKKFCPITYLKTFINEAITYITNSNILYFLAVFLPLCNILYYLLFPTLSRVFLYNFRNTLKLQNTSIVSTFKRYYIYFACLPIYVFLFCIVNYLGYKYIITMEIRDITLYSWIHTLNLDIQIGFLFDALTLVMLFVVISISTLVHIFSIDYMLKDPHIFRFLSYLSLFTFFMIILVTANNFLQLFVGWEGVGLCSYLLINFWFTRLAANKAALKAIIVNRLGDCGLIFAAALIYANFRTFKYSIIFSLIPFFSSKSIIFFSYDINIITFICSLLFLAAVGKSAQIGLHTWLPDAMEGPTPVSALIHAATMVTAGVFLIIRCCLLFEYSEVVLFYMIIFGALTTFLGSLVGVLQYDIKKVIAYSTCSQLGYMVFSSGMSSYFTTLYHLTNHAFFKALLFLSAGVIIHAFSDEQDMRKLGNLRNLLPLVYVFILIGSLALCGFPFYAGWYSKDIIIETSFMDTIIISARFAYWLGAVATFFTAFYSFRLLFLTFFSGVNQFKSYFSLYHEPTKLSLIPLLILVFASLFCGYMLQNFFNLFYGDFFSHSIEALPVHLYTVEFEFLPVYIKLLPCIYTIFAFIFTWYFFEYLKKKFFIFENLEVSLAIYKARKQLIESFPKVSFLSKKEAESLYSLYYLSKIDLSFIKSLFFYSFYISLVFINSIKYVSLIFYFFLKNYINMINIFYFTLNYYIFVFLNKKWHFDALYNLFFNLPLLKISYDLFFVLIDKGLLEIFGPKGLYNFSLKLSRYAESMHIGNLYFMITSFFYGVLSFTLLFDYLF